MSKGRRVGSASHAQALVSQSEPSSSVDDGGLSDSDPDLSSDDDECSSGDKEGQSAEMKIPWNPVDEQRLLAWKKEGNSWKWIFRKFPDRTEQAVRQRLSTLKRRVPTLEPVRSRKAAEAAFKVERVQSDPVGGLLEGEKDVKRSIRSKIGGDV
ncbi:unnamed protein product [Sphagnum balticum]